MNARLLCLCVLAGALAPSAFPDSPQVSEEGKACLDCHKDSTPGIVEQWQSSAHAKNSVDCSFMDCAEPIDSRP